MNADRDLQGARGIRASKLNQQLIGFNMGIGGKIKLEEGTAGGTYVGFKAPDTEVVDDLIWVLPDADGSAGQLMSTDGSMNIVWSDEPASRLAADHFRGYMQMVRIAS